MQKNTNQNQSFNLLKAARPNIPMSEKIFAWISGTCKVLILFTLLIVIVTFSIRIFIDREVHDQREIIKKNTNLLKIYSNEERNIRFLQTNIQNYETLKKDTVTSSKYLDYFMTFKSNFVNYTLNLDEKQFTIGLKGTKDSINNLETSLKNSDLFQNVQVVSLETSNTDQLQNSNITGDIKK